MKAIVLTPEVLDLLQKYPLAKAARTLGVRYGRLRMAAVEAGVVIKTGRPSKDRLEEFRKHQDGTATELPLSESPPEESPVR